LTFGATASSSDDDRVVSDKSAAAAKRVSMRVRIRRARASTRFEPPVKSSAMREYERHARISK